MTLDGSLVASRGILLAVPDEALSSCATELASLVRPGCRVVLHVSGLLTASVLAPLAAADRALGSLHPLISFPTGTGPLVPLRGVLAAVEGNAAATRSARGLARALGMRPRAIAPEVKARYHAAAALAGNLTHALVVAAREELEACGFGPREARAALAPLLSGALSEALAARGWERLTGPLARGDAATTAAHMTALSAPTAAAYREVGRLVVERLLGARILSEQAAARLVSALTGLGFSASVPPMARLGSH